MHHKSRTDVRTIIKHGGIDGHTELVGVCLQLSGARTCQHRTAAGSNVTVTTCQSAATAFSARGTSRAMEPTGSASSETATTSPARRLVCSACVILSCLLRATRDQK